MRSGCHSNVTAINATLLTISFIYLLFCFFPLLHFGGYISAILFRALVHAIMEHLTILAHISKVQLCNALQMSRYLLFLSLSLHKN